MQDELETIKRNILYLSEKIGTYSFDHPTETSEFLKDREQLMRDLLKRIEVYKLKCNDELTTFESEKVFGKTKEKFISNFKKIFDPLNESLTDTTSVLREKWRNEEEKISGKTMKKIKDYSEYKINEFFNSIKHRNAPPEPEPEPEPEKEDISEHSSKSKGKRSKAAKEIFSFLLTSSEKKTRNRKNIEPTKENLSKLEKEVKALSEKSKFMGIEHINMLREAKLLKKTNAKLEKENEEKDKNNKELANEKNKIRKHLNYTEDIMNEINVNESKLEWYIEKARIKRLEINGLEQIYESDEDTIDIQASKIATKSKEDEPSDIEKLNKELEAAKKENEKLLEMLDMSEKCTFLEFEIRYNKEGIEKKRYIDTSKITFQTHKEEENEEEDTEQNEEDLSRDLFNCSANDVSLDGIL